MSTQANKTVPERVSGFSKPSWPRRLYRRFQQMIAYLPGVGFDAFISYRRVDGRHYAEDLHRRLGNKLVIFFDRDQIHISPKLRWTLRRAIRGCRQFWLIDTPQARARQSKWVPEEVDIALNRTKQPRIVHIEHPCASYLAGNNLIDPKRLDFDPTREPLQAFVEGKASENVVEGIIRLSDGLTTKRVADIALRIVGFTFLFLIWLGVGTFVNNTAFRTQKQSSASIKTMDSWAFWSKWVFARLGPKDVADNVDLKHRRNLPFGDVKIIDSVVGDDGRLIVISQDMVYRGVDTIALTVTQAKRLQDVMVSMHLPYTAKSAENLTGGVSENGAMTAILFSGSLNVTSNSFGPKEQRWHNCADPFGEPVTGFDLDRTGAVLAGRTADRLLIFTTANGACQNEPIDLEKSSKESHDSRRTSTPYPNPYCVPRQKNNLFVHRRRGGNVALNTAGNLAAMTLGSDIFVYDRKRSESTTIRTAGTVCDVVFGADNRLVYALHDTVVVISEPFAKERKEVSEFDLPQVSFFFDQLRCNLLTLATTDDSVLKRWDLCEMVTNEDKFRIPSSGQARVEAAILVGEYIVLGRKGVEILERARIRPDILAEPEAAPRVLDGSESKPANGGNNVKKFYTKDEWLIAQRSRQNIDIYEIRQETR